MAARENQFQTIIRDFFPIGFYRRFVGRKERSLLLDLHAQVCLSSHPVARTISGGRKNPGCWLIWYLVYPPFKRRFKGLLNDIFSKFEVAVTKSNGRCEDQPVILSEYAFNSRANA